LPAIFTITDSLAQKEVIWGEDNVFKTFLVDKGNVDEVWAQADLIVEANTTRAPRSSSISRTWRRSLWRTQRTASRFGVRCSALTTFHKALLKLFNLPEEKIRVIQTETGGGFGGKEEYPSMIAGHAALLAWKSGKPVKMIYDRAEDMVPQPSVIVARASQDGGDERGKTPRHGDRFCDRRRRLLHPVSGGVVTRQQFTPQVRIFVPTCAYTARRLPPTCRRTGRSEDFGAPQSIFASSARWTKSQRPWL